MKNKIVEQSVIMAFSVTTGIDSSSYALTSGD